MFVQPGESSVAILYWRRMRVLRRQSVVYREYLNPSLLDLDGKRLDEQGDIALYSTASMGV
jgi:hypothetical protein